MRVSQFSRSVGVLLAFLVALVAFPATSVAAAPESGTQAEDFSIVVLPDTQYASRAYPQVWDSTGKWIAKQKDAKSIKYALHAGDIVDQSGKDIQWQRAVNGMDYLQDAVPYILGVGNHDMDDTASRKTTKFNKNFPVKKFSDLPSFGGSYPEGKNDNSYHSFSAGGTDWLIVSLKYDPTKAEIEWANKVVADHPDHQTMVVTHAYQKGEKKTDIGKRVWKEFVSKHENISFVFSGHHVAAGMIEEKGAKGNTVYQVQADYQNLDKEEPNSYFRHMTFSPSKKTVDVKTYSPHVDKYKDDAANQFTIKNFEFMPAK